MRFIVSSGFVKGSCDRSQKNMWQYARQSRNDESKLEIAELSASEVKNKTALTCGSLVSANNSATFVSNRRLLWNSTSPF
jgi:hypothetical protein